MGIVSVTTFPNADDTVTNVLLNGLAGNLVTEFNGNIDNANVKANAAIAYSKLNLTGALLAADQSATGTPSSSTFLRGDDTWASAGGAPTDATYITQTANGSLSNEQAISSLSDGLLKHSSGVLAQAVAGTDYSTPSSTDTLTNKTIDANGTGNSISNIEDADVAAAAAIGFSKLAALTATNILVGNGSNVAVSVAMSGDTTISNAGVVAIASDVIINADVKSDAAIALSKLATTGTLTSTDLADGTTTLNVTELGAGVISFIIDGGGSTITTGVKGDLEIPFACTIQRVTMLADQSGSIVVDIFKDTYANFPPTVADTITASAKPTITTDTDSQDTTLTGWTTSVAVGDTFRYNVDSVTTIERVTISLKIVKV